MISDVEVVLRLLTAAVLGSIIGVNRGRLEWAAELRMHMLVSVGAALTVIVPLTDSATRPSRITWCWTLPALLRR